MASLLDAPTSTIAIRPYEPGDDRAFSALNKTWIEKYFVLEHEDILTLGDPEAQIIAKGGQVIMATDDGKAIGCCALIPAGDKTLELAKMAVDDDYCGRGIGRRLLTSALDEARRLGAAAIILGSNTKLANAVHLYESVGFEHVAPEELPPSPYSRANVHMKLDLLRKR